MRRERGRRGRAWVLTTTASVIALMACSRTPPEPAQATSAPLVAPAAPSRGAAPAASHAAAPARCIHETPDVPPPSPTAAPKDLCPKDPGAPGALPKVSVTFLDAKVDGGAATPVRVDAELARAPAETERGLMFRTKMAEDHGMLFDLGDRREHVFWMRNTCLPLDMLFVDDDGTIVGVLENVPTLNDEERTVGCPSSWVLEVNAGWSRRHGVRAGQRLKLPPR